MMKTAMAKYSLLALMMLMLAGVVLPGHAAAQTPGQNNAAAEEDEPPIRLETPYQPFNQSLFFSEEDIIRIRIALAGIKSDIVSEDAEPPGERLLRLSGITYATPDRWMIWLNGMRVTPHNMPPELIDINVTRDYVDMKWFDNWLKKIIRIRLRPNQVYDINTGIMLPG